LIEEWWERCVAARPALASTRLIHTYRAHKGFAHPAQVRNNGVRAIERALGLDDRDLVVGIDGDIVLARDAVARHTSVAAGGADLIIGFRVCLTPTATERVSAEAILAGLDLSSLAEARELESLARRDKRYRRQLALRTMSPSFLRRAVVKPHKPKLISAHYAVRVAKLREVNGFDEGYTNYGYEDDDLGRRLHLAGARTCIEVAGVRAFHMWHPTRAPARPTDAPGFARFKQPDLPVFAEHGWVNPAPQPAPTVRIISSSA
jgi:GT2 family glycosyltransferase